MDNFPLNVANGDNNNNNCINSHGESKDEIDWNQFRNIFSNDLLPNANGKEITSDFMNKMFQLLFNYVIETNTRSSKVVDFHYPENMKTMMDSCFELTEKPQDLKQILSDCKQTLKYCVKTGHPCFFNMFPQGLDMISLSGEWLTSTAYTNNYTYEMAPVFSLMEEMVLSKMLNMIGWKDGDGIFSPGGTISNLYASHAARFKCIPEAKSKGLYGYKPLVMFTSDQVHYSIQNASSILGIGTDNVVYIETDSEGKMIPKELEKAICRIQQEDKMPYFVCASAGTTVIGAFDPLTEIADICSKYNLWMHVDAAWGGSALFSRKYKHLLTGIERADSVAWNPHKLMGIILQCSVILFKKKGLLSECNSLHASYLFQKDKFYDVAHDTGDKTIQCGRPNNVFKIWLTWRAKGDEGFEKHINYFMDISMYLLELLKKREGFKMVFENPQFINVCFWYIPKKIRHLATEKDFNAKLNKVAPQIKKLMMEKGSTMVAYQPLQNYPNFFRMVVSNPATTYADMDFLVEEIATLGESIDIA